MSDIIEHGTELWREARCGLVTGSKFKDVMTAGRGGQQWGGTALGYALKVAAERITGEVADEFTNAAMEHGIIHEPVAIAEYERATFSLVTYPGLLLKPDTNIGGTPDGFVGKDGMIEVKCPATTHRHLATLLDRVVPPEYIPQVQGYLWLSGRQWCDYVSFHPSFPPSQRLVILRQQRNDAYISELALRVLEFDKLVDKMVSDAGSTR